MWWTLSLRALRESEHDASISKYINYVNLNHCSFLLASNASSRDWSTLSIGKYIRLDVAYPESHPRILLTSNT